jgi:hypothetical protein
VFCKHLDFYGGGGGEYPEPAALECMKKHDLREKTGWSNYQSVYDMDDFRAMIVTAKNCPDYSPPDEQPSSR